MKFLFLTTTSIALILWSHSLLAMGQDDPLLSFINVDNLELREADETSFALEADAWYGRDINKLWLKTEIEADRESTEDAELQALYSRAVSPFWDAQIGVRADFDSASDRQYLVLGLQGLAPFFLDADLSYFLSSDGDSSFRVSSEYELMLAQNWILVPELEANFFGQNNAEYGEGSGLSDLELGLRLQYRVTRQFLPYLGVVHETRFGNAADFAEAENEEKSETFLVLGLHAWF